MQYFQIIGKDSHSDEDASRLSEITKEREENAKIVSRLLQQIESN